MMSSQRKVADRGGRSGAGATTDAPRLFRQAVEAHLGGEVERAEGLYRQLLACHPDHAESWSNFALALLSRKACAEAAVACRRAIALLPHYVEAHLNLAAALEGVGETDGALEAHGAAVALRPEDVGLRVGLAGLLERAGRPGRAVDAYAEALPLAPGNALLRFNRGRLLASLGRGEEAVAAFREALAIAPDMVEALSSLGSALVSLGRHAEADEAGSRAAALLPDNVEVINNHAVVLHQQGRAAEAAELYRRALAVDPLYHNAWANLGVAYQDLFRFDDAMEAFDRAVSLKPDFHTAVVEAVKIRRHICDWSRYEADRGMLLDLIGQDTPAIFMLLLMAFDSTAEQQFACARQHMARLNRDPERIGAVAPRLVNARLKVGYLSADYRDHPVGRLLPEMLAQHDRGAFEVFGYALGRDDPGRVRRRIARACDHFVDLHALSNREAAARIRDDRIDVLVDLTGPTTGSRLEILNLRPAPVQVSFIGWPGTTGADCMDYVVGDPFLTSGDQQAVYSEKIVQLPLCYQPSDPYRATSLPPVTRADCGLPDDAVVFCSFNNTLKLTPDLFDVWLKLLARVEGSVLWLYCKTARTMENLKAWAETRGVSAERIVFAPVSTMDLYLSRLRLADLFLDSYPYNAGATCNDALWMGLPVLTWTGDTYVSRMAGSLLRAMNLPELITRSAEDYEAMAVRLATEPGLLAGIRARLLRGRDASRLFDMPGFTASWEKALTHMRYRSVCGLAPEGFGIPESTM